MRERNLPHGQTADNFFYAKRERLIYVLFFMMFSNTFLSRSLEATLLPALETEMSAAEPTAGVLLKVPCF